MGSLPRLRFVVVGSLVLAAAACRDAFFFEPPRSGATVRVALSLNEGTGGLAGGPAEAFDAADSARVTLRAGATVVHDEVVALEPAGPDRKAGLRVDVTEETTLEVSVELRQGSRGLFSGRGQVTLAPGETRTVDVGLTAVAHQLTVDLDSVSIRNLGFSAQLDAAVLFATGDTVTGAEVTWSSLNPDVAQVSSTGEVTSAGFGTTAVRAALDSLVQEVSVTVVDPCQESVAIQVGDPVDATFTADDCFVPETGGTFGMDFFRFTLEGPRQAVVQVAVGEVPFDPSFTVQDSEGVTWAFPLASGPEVAAPVALGPGEYTVRVAGQNLEGESLPYTFQVFDLPEDFSGCPYVWTTPGGVLRGVMNLGDEGSPYPPPSEHCRAWDFQIDRWEDRMTGFIQDNTTFVFELVGEIDVMFSMFENFGGSPGKLRRQAEAAAGDTIRIFSYQDRRSFPGFAVSALNLNSGEEGPYTMRFRELDGPPPGSSIAGQVVDAETGTPMQIRWVHVDGPTSLRIRPDSMGMLDAFGLPAGDYTLRTEAEGFIESLTEVTLGADEDVFLTLPISPILDPGQTRIVLSWNETAQDLDAHLTGPDGSGGTFHVWFGNRGSDSATPFTALDVDDTDGSGPETVTIFQQFSGVYCYSVDNFSGETALSASGARVEVFQESSRLASFSVPDQPGELWTVFALDEAGITPVNELASGDPPGACQ